MSQAIIAADNLLESATSVVASSEAVGFPAANAWDGVTSTYWQPSGTGDHALTATFAAAVSVDFFACYGHNLASAGGSIVLQYSLDGGATWTDCFAALTPDDNACVLQRFAAVAAPRWRVKAHAATAPLYLAAVAFGAAIVAYRGMPVGFVPPAAARVTEIIPNSTEGGAIAGRSIIPRGAETTIQINYVTMDWERSVWRPFVRRAERKPFFFSWNHRDYPDECVFAMAKMPIPPAQMNEYKLYNLSMPITCMLQDTAP